MKTTVKEFETKTTFRKFVKNERENAIMAEDWDRVAEADELLEGLENNYFSQLETVAVSYMIGSRNYYQEVIKIGKSYFLHGRKMTKGRGYWFIQEIEEITEEMNNEMIADSYYY